MGLLDALKSALGLGSRDREPDTESSAVEPEVESEAAVKGTDHADEPAAGTERVDETAETPGQEASTGAATSDTSAGASGATGTAGSVESGDDTGETTGSDTAGSAAESDAAESEPGDTDVTGTDATGTDATDADAESRTDVDGPGVEDAEPATTEEADPAVTDDEEQADIEDEGDTQGGEDAAAAELPPGVAEEPVDSVNGVGPAYAARLEKAGIATVGDLVTADTDAVAEESEIAASRIERWQERARDV